MKTDKVFLSGIGTALLPGDLSDRFSLSSFQKGQSKVGRKLLRYCSRSSLWAIEASDRAMRHAGIELSDNNSGWGLYTNQYGYQHPDLDDMCGAWKNWQPEQDSSFFKTLWDSKEISPFLLIQGLSNNLVGMLSLYFNMQADCAAFVRDETGETAALSEALFSIRNNLCDRALVVCAGSDKDYVSRDLDCSETPMQAVSNDERSSAVALVLESQSSLAERNGVAIAELTSVESGHMNAKTFGMNTIGPQIESANKIICKLNHAELNSNFDDKIRSVSPDIEIVNLDEYMRHTYNPGLMLAIATGFSNYEIDDELLAMSCGHDDYLTVAQFRKEMVV